MILYVETNFVLELAYGQEEHESCRSLVDLAARGDALELALPGSCVVEAHGRQIRRQRERAVWRGGVHLFSHRSPAKSRALSVLYGVRFVIRRFLVLSAARHRGSFERGSFFF